MNSRQHNDPNPERRSDSLVDDPNTEEDIVDIAGEESFPASDPPSWTGGITGQSSEFPEISE